MPEGIHDTTNDVTDLIDYYILSLNNNNNNNNNT